MTKYLIIALVLAIGYGSWQTKRAIFNKNESERHEQNYKQVLSKSDKLTLYLDEAQMKEGLLKDSLAAANLALLNVKPEKVIEYVTITVSSKDTNKVVADVTPSTKFTESSIYYFISPMGNSCFSFSGYVDIESVMPEVVVTEQTYNDSLAYILYEQRNRVNWIPFKPRWGKKNNKLEILSECGETKYERNIKVEKGKPSN